MSRIDEKIAIRYCTYNSTYTISTSYQLLTRERVASIRDIQKNPSRALRGVTRVMRGAKTFGFFFSPEEFDDLMEDFEASMCESLKREVKKARGKLKKGDIVPLSVIAKQ